MATEWGGWTRNGALTVFRRSTGRGPGGTEGRVLAGRPRKYSPVSSGGIGTSTVIRGRGEGGGGERETGTTNINEGSRVSTKVVRLKD